MSDRIKKAVEKHQKGFSCSQSVVCSYCDLFGIDEETAYRVSEGFGQGMGHKGTCGAVTAMAILAGMKNSDGNTAQPGGTKKETVPTVKEMSDRFLEKNKSIICAELLGETGGPVLRSCDGCVEDAAKIVEEILL